MKCRICNNTEGNTKYTAKENMFGIGETFEYFECGNCKCVQIAEIPGNMKKYYPENYYSFGKVNADGAGSLKKQLIISRDKYIVSKKGFLGGLLNSIWPGKGLLEILGELELDLNSRILDVGSGSGSKLLPLKDIGIDVKGIDPFLANKIEYDNGLVIEKKSLEDLNQTFDLIMFNHVYEHLDDPLKTLQITKRLLADKGICLIRIPISSSYAWEKYRTNWVQLDAPRHFFLHSTNSMELLAEKAGFKVKRIIYDSTTFQFIGSELYSKNITFTNGDFSERNNKYFTDQELIEFEKKTIELNKKAQGDQAAFVLIRS